MLGLVLSGCPTRFTGDAHFPDGPSGCRKACERSGMQMGAYVYAGEYSTACVCTPKGSGANTGATSLGMAVVGVITQLRAAQQQQAAMAH